MCSKPFTISSRRLCLGFRHLGACGRERVVMLLDSMRTGLFLPLEPSAWRRLARAPSTALFICRPLFLCALLALAPLFTFAREAAKLTDLWSLKPLVRPEIPSGMGSATNPIDA